MNVQIQGGERDGDVVPYMGPEIRMPRRPRPVFVSDDPERLPPVTATFHDDRYVLMRSFAGELYYVAEGEARARRSAG